MINPLGERLSNKIANMGFLCALLVVVIHLSGDTVSKTMYLLLGMTTEGVCRIAVPFFFTTAGFLLAGRTDEVGWWGQSLKSRVRSLVVPFLLIGLINCGIALVQTVGGNLLRGRGVFAGLPDVGWWLTEMGFNPCAFPGHWVMWFVRALFLLVLVSPVLVWGLRRVGWGLVGGLFVVWTLTQPFVLGASEPILRLWGTTVSVSGFFWFTLGLQLRLTGARLTCRWPMHLAALVVGLLLVAGRLVWNLSSEHALPGYWVNWLYIGLMLWGAWGLSPGCVRIKTAWMAFPIFLIHGYVIAALRLTGIPPSYASPEHFVFEGCVVIAASMSAAHALARYVPGLARILFGGRTLSTNQHAEIRCR